MTAASHSPLVTRVARVLCRWRNGKKLAFPDFEGLPAPEKTAYLEQAQAALTACRAEELREALQLLVSAKEMKNLGGDTPDYRAMKDEGWSRARTVLAKLDDAS